ncbi:hypothetical protein [Roseibium sp. RKSG952]|uniref:hypothetical protein n=1 Tax=Roseibium sp. RKSG952 TaxID=2529384 RepID=UPI0012BBD0D6|nr:hypothetical protein [Roseibium sp. RKSG952]MTH95414.1 hypothetical protein [Roseibium sp. RKSG952]
MAKAVCELDGAIKKLGVSDIRLSSDVEELEFSSAQAVAGSSISEHFRRSLNTLPPNQLLWVGLYDDRGECIGTCASKYEDGRGWSLQQLITQYFERVFLAEGGGKVRLASGSTAFAGMVSGTTVYVGGGYVSRAWRGRNLLGLCQRLLILTAFSKWQPDIVYGFMRPDKIQQNYHLNWGYSIAKPVALIWDKKPEQTDLHNLYFVGLGAEGICRLASDPMLTGHSIHHVSNTSRMSHPGPSRMEVSISGNEV